MSARHPGNIAALAAIAPPRIAVVLNVGTAHLGEFGSRQAIADTKAELPQAVPPSGVVVLNVDDTRGGRDGRQDRGAGGPGQPAHAESTCGPKTSSSTTWPGPRFTLHARRTRPSTVQLAVFGDHQVSNALCAAAVALECGATGEQVAAALAAAGPASPAGWTSSPAPTASPSSTTPTTPTPTRCVPACRHWPGWPDPDG